MMKLQRVLNLHEAMKGCYFFQPPASAGQRRAYEAHNSLETEIIHDGKTIGISQVTECSCKNVYYKMSITIDG